jgi:cytochrome P450
VLTAVLVPVLAAVFLASLPWWLPRIVIALRLRIFARVNGGEGVPVPGPLVDAEHFKDVYGHPAADGRSRGAALSDLFWYWLSPGAELHQEHLEPGPRYDEVTRTTRRILGMPRREAEELATACTARVLGELTGGTTGKDSGARARLVRLRDAMMPVWAEFYHELVFGERCPRHVRDLIVANADDVVTALKCCGLRHMDRRDRLTAHLLARVEAGEVPHELPAGLTPRQQALYLQGTFFNTAVVQSSEAMAHLFMVLAHHRDVQAEAAAGGRLLDHVMDETFRLYPLFGVAHRITSADIPVDGPDGTTVLPAGSVLLFDYAAYHRTGFTDPDAFRPARWEELAARDAHHIPFGIAANRPCPAWRLAPLTMRAAALEVLRRHELRTSAAHTRSLPNRGPCLLLPKRDGARPRHPAVLRAALGHVWLRDRREDVTRSLVQLVLGSYMVWDARRKQLCTRHFEAAPPESRRADHTVRR